MAMPDVDVMRPGKITDPLGAELVPDGHKMVELWHTAVRGAERRMILRNDTTWLKVSVQAADGAGKIDFAASGLHTADGIELWVPCAWTLEAGGKAGEAETHENGVSR